MISTHQMQAPLSEGAGSPHDMKGQRLEVRGALAEKCWHSHWDRGEGTMMTHSSPHQTCKYITLCDIRDFADVIKGESLKVKSLPWL